MNPTTIPILPSASLERTEQFYTRLGFVAHGRWPGEYLILRRQDGIELHFWCHPGVERLTNMASCFIRFPTAADVRRVHADWASQSAPEATLTYPAETDYGLLEAGLTDPDGNLLRLGGALKT